MPITREQVLGVLKGRGRPALSARGILVRLDGHRGQAKALRTLLRALVAEGLLERVERSYRLARTDGLIEAFVQGGGGDRLRVQDDNAFEWLVSSDTRVREGDRVLVLPGDAPNRGEILQVLSGRRDRWIGIFGRDRGATWVTPYRDEARWRIRIGPRDSGGARFGEVVVVELLSERGHAASRASGHRSRGRRSKNARSERRGARPAALEQNGRIVERLGRPGGAEADFHAIVWRHRLAIDFPAAAITEAEAYDPVVAASELERRLDLRDRCFITIDPASARDHDDAVCVEPIPGKNGGEETRLWVAIADVAHFVKPGSALDREALQRGNSFYFPDRSIPMLPERLSGDLCSLRPQTDRLALVVELTVDAGGACHRPRFHEAVVRSQERLSYQEAAQVMEGGRAERSWDAEVSQQLVAFAAVAERLLQHRSRDGSIDFDLPEAQVVLDDKGWPIDIRRSERTRAHRAVEDAMLAANRAVASALAARRLSAVFRVHEPPSEERLAALAELFAAYGLAGGGDAGLNRQSLAAALRRAHGRPEESLLNLAALRSMQQARYHAENLGHYALGFDSYLHFTSPIRRYADLVVHRQVKRHLVGGGSRDQHPEQQGERADAGARQVEERMRLVSVRTSFRERVAVQAERDTLELKRCALMSSRVGEEFSGLVSSVAPHGLYVTLDEPFVDGLVHVSELGDSMEFEERGQSLVARRSGRRYRLGERLDVRLIAVDPVKGWISFALAGANTSPQQAPVKPRPKHRGKTAARRKRG